ncbi:hypothetical protein Lal_00033691 [Lupinus albus]|nr:hypothetical protein Lal_00033691 [Lupinus albus]
MVSHILRRDPTYPKQVSKGRRELESRVLPLLKLLDEYQSSLPLEKLYSLTSLQYLTLKYLTLSLRRGSSRSGEDSLAQARILQPRHVQNVRQLSLRRDHSRSSETTLAQGESFSIAQDFTLPDVSWYSAQNVQADYQSRRPQDKTVQFSVMRFLTAL